MTHDVAAYQLDMLGGAPKVGRYRSPFYQAAWAGIRLPLGEDERRQVEMIQALRAEVEE